MQQANEKTAEPSMEDILASIRKIIAEEPAAPASAAPRVSTNGPGAPPPPVSQQRPQPPASPAPRAAVPPMIARQPEPIAAQPAPTRLSDLMREFAPTAVPVTAPTIVSFHDDLDDLVEGGSAPSPTPAAKAPQPAAAAVVPAPRFDFRPEPMMSRQSSTVEAVSPVAADGFTERKSTGLGAFVPKNRDTFAPAQRAEAAPDFNLPEFNQVERGAPPAGVAEPLPLPMAQPSAPQSLQPEQVSPEPEPEAVASSGPDDAVAAAQSALGALALGLAAPSNTSMIVAPTNHAEPVAMESAAPQRRQSLDDAVVDMLRPMVREWLDAHLPEMVEQALRLEMADSLKRSN